MPGPEPFAVDQEHAVEDPGGETGALERARGELAVSLGLAAPGSCSFQLAVLQMQAVDAELARRHG
jgi:hypothetical protein